jgi:hypothetical protein
MGRSAHPYDNLENDMKQSTRDLTRRMLADRIRYLATELGKPGAATNPVREYAESLLAEMKTAHEALADLIADENTAANGVNPLAAEALGELEKSVEALRQVDNLFVQGSGKGSPAHKQVKRLLALVHTGEEVAQPTPPSNGRPAA